MRDCSRDIGRRCAVNDGLAYNNSVRKKPIFACENRLHFPRIHLKKHEMLF